MVFFFFVRSVVLMPALMCRAIREAPQWTEERRMIALEACKAVGAVMEHLEERNEMSETPLIREAADGNAKNVLLLLEAGADVDSQQMNNIGFTALNQAGCTIQLHSLSYLQLLISLHGLTAYFGHPQCIIHLLKFRAEVDSLDMYGGTPLVAAALNGEVECVQALLDASANVNHATTNLNTPLMKAALNGHVACVRVLLGWGADATKTNNVNITAKQLALKSMEAEKQKLCEIKGKSYSSRSIEEKRKKETIRRLEKRIADHETVLKDLDMDKDLIKTQYSDLFEPQGLDAAMQTTDAEHS